MEYGYSGTIARVDLTTGRVEIETPDEDVLRKYLGGKGLGAYLLSKELKPGIDPLSPENVLIFATGPLTGTNFPAVSRSGVITKSPLTGTFLDSYSGGFFGTQLKWAGFDAVVITGRSEKPALLTLDSGSVGISDADGLWGLTTTETEEHIRAEMADHPKQKMSIAAIGPAGENLVRFANIINERRAHGRGGAGAVMGSKNLKAVVAKGKQKPRTADEERYKEALRAARDRISANPSTKKGGHFNHYGTTSTINLTNHTGTLPAKNWTGNIFADTEKVDGDTMLAHQIRQRYCFSCPIGCSRETVATFDGKEYRTEGPDYETMFALGPNCAINDPAVIIAADQLCDDYGMDTISCGGVIGFAMECAEKGLLNKEMTGGLDLGFGNGKALIEAVHLIARKEGIGKVLADGVKRASETIPESEEFAIHVKGMELPGYDPRGMKGQGLTYAVADRGACHVRSNTLRTELLGAGMPKPMDRYAYAEKAEMVRNLQLLYAACDCMIACAFGSSAISMEIYADAIAAVTGWDFTEKELMTVAERSWNMSRLFNLREGFGRKDDTLPPRLFYLPSTDGPSKGQVVERGAFEEMLEEYYGIVGWDPKTGIPTAEKLASLGLAS